MLLAISWVLLSAHARAQGPDASLVTALSDVRASGCGTSDAHLPALRPSAALDEAARRTARGQNAMQAARGAGYRAKRIFQASFSGYAAAPAVAQAMRERYCAALGDRDLSEAGWHREGDRWWIVVAAPYDLPQLAEAPAVARRVLALTNEARSRPRRCGAREFAAAPPLAANELLTRAAQAHASDMASHDYIEHKGRDGSTASQRLTRVGYRWRDVGENIAAGQVSSEEVAQDWLKSPEHCANIMEPSFTEMGLAFGVNMQGSAVIYWTQVFARPR